MNKFDRKYKLSVGLFGGGTLEIAPPFTIEFDIKRNTFSSANISSVRIHNLSQKNRRLIRKDVNQFGDVRQLVLSAGYGDNLPVVFKGQITQAWSVRESVDFITEIQCFDAGYAFQNATFNQNFPSGTSNTTIIDSMMTSLGSFGVTKGVIGGVSGTIGRGNAFAGNTSSIITELTGGGFFIDNGVANVLSQNQYIEGDVLLINAASGLLGTPLREQTNVRVDILFEPRVKPGYLVQVESIGEEGFDNYYKVIAVHHRGIISETVAGSCTTSLTLLNDKTLTGVR